jgi:diguanylate cyclase (GGDEF)-like protein
MSFLSIIRQAFLSSGDVLLSYRDRVALQLSVVSAVLLVPFMLAQWVNGNLGLAVAIALVAAILAVNARALQHQRAAPVPFEGLVIVMLLAVVMAVHVLGLKGIFWTYPGLFIVYFLVNRRLALVVSLLFVVMVTVLTYQHLGASVAARVGATLVLTLVMINVVLNVIGELQEALVTQTITDPLTGAFNRRHFDSRLRSLTGEGNAAESRRPAPSNALLALDVDHFKTINDRHGHDVGDEVLKAVVALVEQRKRQSDQLFRTGGEEFMLLLAGTTREDALKVAETLRELVAQAPLLAGETVTVSIGVSMQMPGQGGSDWMKRGDQALYEAKRAGRNRVVLAT